MHRRIPTLSFVFPVSVVIRITGPNNDRELVSRRSECARTVKTTVLDWLKYHRVRRSAARSNEDWILGLKENDPVLLADLRSILVIALLPVLRTKIPRQARTLADDFAQEALLKILDRLETYRGEAKFTSWGAKIAVRVALSELRKARWADISLEGAATADMTSVSSETPERSIIREESVEILRKLILTELTEKQRTAIMAVMLGGMPLEEVARRMTMNRNALYKLLHDARLKLRRAIEEQGMSVDDFEIGSV